MIKLSYYIIGIIFAYYKHKNFFDISNKLNTIDFFTKLKEDGLPDNSINSELEMNIIKDGIVSFSFFLWMLIGLTTYNWLFFLWILLFGLFIINPLSRKYKNNLKIKILLTQFYYILTWLLCIFVLLNTYYFQIDSEQVFKLFKNGQ